MSHILIPYSEEGLYALQNQDRADGLNLQTLLQCFKQPLQADASSLRAITSTLLKLETSKNESCKFSELYVMSPERMAAFHMLGKLNDPEFDSVTTPKQANPSSSARIYWDFFWRFSLGA